jgi:DNA-binding CsgD family transcriptional regulator
LTHSPSTRRQRASEELAHTCLLDELNRPGLPGAAMTTASPATPRCQAQVHEVFASPSGSLSEVLLRLYANAPDAGIGEFEREFLATLQRHVPFDAAWTGRSTFVSAWPLLHSSYLDRLPRSFVQDWQAVRYFDPLAQNGNRRPGKAMVSSLSKPDIPSEFRWFGSRHELAHVMNVASRENSGGLVTFLSLYRRSSEHPFTAQESRLLEDVVPHLDLALDFNRSHHLSRLGHGPDAAVAVCDHFGLVHQATHGFRKKLLVEWPRWRGQWLPADLVEQVQRHPRTPYVGQRLRVDVADVAGLLQLDATERPPTDLLSAREWAVLRHYGEGLTYKEVARQINIAPATVRHHLRNAYKKLGVSNKGQMLRTLNRH